MGNAIIISILHFWLRLRISWLCECSLWRLITWLTWLYKLDFKCKNRFFWFFAYKFLSIAILIVKLSFGSKSRPKIPSSVMICWFLLVFLHFFYLYIFDHIVNHHTSLRLGCWLLYEPHFFIKTTRYSAKIGNRFRIPSVLYSLHGITVIVVLEFGIRIIF